MTEKKVARCKKCGRVLKSPDSIARGMGPECAGVTPRKGKSPRARSRSPSGKTYQVYESGTQLALTAISTPGEPKKLSAAEKRRLDAKAKRAERLKKFQERERFHAGRLIGSNKPLFYSPVGNDCWLSEFNQKTISTEELLAYLKRYNFV